MIPSPLPAGDGPGNPEDAMTNWPVLALIGSAAGLAAGLFGVGGGIVLVPALIYWAGLSQHLATGTAVAVMLPPIGLAAAIEYHRHGNVDLRVAIVVAAGMFLGAWLGALLANHMEGPYLQLLFGVFVCAIGVYLVHGAAADLGWL